MGKQIAIPKAELEEFCRRNHILKLSLFGSVLREDFGPESDVDVLYEVEPGQTIGFKIFDMEEELSRIFGGIKIDLVNAKYLNRHLRDEVLAEAEVQYEKE